MYRNHIELIGFTCSDAETKTTPQGKTVTTFSIATNILYIRTEIVRNGPNGTASGPGGKLGEYAAAFKKGSHICVEGELRSRDYESHGVKVRTYDIVASAIINLGKGQRCAQTDSADAAA